MVISNGNEQLLDQTTLIYLHLVQCFSGILSAVGSFSFVLVLADIVIHDYTVSVNDDLMSLL